MLPRILTNAAQPVFMPFILKRHGGIWGLKQRLVECRNPNPWLVQAYYAFFQRYGSWIGLEAQLAGIPCFPHGFHGVFIPGDARLGKDVVIFQQVTIGSNTLNESDRAGAPVIGDHVYIGAGAKIIGKVTVGHHCRIGANAVVYEDMPPHSVAVQAPTRILQKANLDNRFYSRKPDGCWVYYQDGRWVEDHEKPRVQPE